MIVDVTVLVVVAEGVAEVVDVDMAVEPACGTGAAELRMKMAVAGTVNVAVAVVVDDALGVKAVDVLPEDWVVVDVDVDVAVVVQVVVTVAVAADVAVVDALGVSGAAEVAFFNDALDASVLVAVVSAVEAVEVVAAGRGGVLDVHTPLSLAAGGGGQDRDRGA